MIDTRRRSHARFGTAARIVALLLATMHALLVAAPLGERADSGVAAIHVEQAGTSTHHAHGELCALVRRIAPRRAARAAPIAALDATVGAQANPEARHVVRRSGTARQPASRTARLTHRA